MVLNLGHTFGHAIEKAYNFEKYTHGEAVAAGMVMAAELGERRGICALGTSKRLRRMVCGFNLPESVELGSGAFAEAAAVDKKREGAMINLIIPKCVGEVVIDRVPLDEMMV